MNERISVTVALSVTVDPKSWYSRFHADPGIDIPDRMLSHLRMLPGIQETGGNVELRRLIRRGSRHCRQSPQHRGVMRNSMNKPANTTLALLRSNRINTDHLRRLCRYLRTAAYTMPRMLLTLDRRIPTEPSADFL